MPMPGSFVESIAAGNVIDPGEMSRVEKLYEEILLETDRSRLAARNASIYAEALLNVARAQKVDIEIGDELHSLAREVFVAHPVLAEFFANPAVHRKRKMAVIEKAFTDKCSPLFLDFLKLLCKHDRMTHLRLIAVSYQALRDKLAKRIRILVESAVPLDESQLEKLRAMLAERLHETPILINRIKENLLGGIRLHVGDKVFDSTVLYRLDALRTKFLARGSHEIQTGRDRFSSNV
ncbi:MAG: ATP synthase F1 subunit delta [Planctomycetes bacterium]|nr:ATP synthase F1 subunit delta [Planctomycetota bacterium]